MREYARLYAAIDETNKTTGKVAAMADYFRTAPPADAAWAVHFLIGRRPKRLVSGPKLWGWAAGESKLPGWLFAECYEAVGDLAETIALALPEPTAEPADEGRESLTQWVERRLLPLAQMDEDAQREAMLAAWSELDLQGRLVWNKLITGSFRVGVSQDLVIRALSQASDVPGPAIAHRLMGQWEPTAGFFQSLVSEESGEEVVSRPYPFCLAHPHEGDPAALGPIEDWHAEWKWDGIRTQVIRRQEQSFIWSRGEDLITERFPEIREIADRLPDGTVLDGEILAWRDDKPMTFLDLQKRIGRKVLGKKILQEVPVVLVAFDLLEWEGRDVREEPLSWRRELLESLADQVEALRVSPSLEAASWEDLARQREESRSHNVEGLMLKRHDSPYVVGRKKGNWWKWKIDPMTLDCVLIYAQRGSGIRASLYTDYTFGVWHEGKLVPFAKAYSGLTDEEIRKVDAWIRRNTVEKFGPVRSVKPDLVFELAFESIQLSRRHKSGVAVRFPRIARWRQDKPASEAESLETIREMLEGLQQTGQ
jgi:DNA ligase 1